MATCNDLIAGLNPDCTSLKKVGGTNKRVWIGKKDNISISTDTAGYINSIAMSNIGSIPSKLYKFSGKKDKNNAIWPVVAGENINTFNHTAVLSLYYGNPTELLAIENLVNAAELVVFMQMNDDKIIVLGTDVGLVCTAAEGGTGTLLNDSTAYVVTLSAENKTIPKYFSVNGTTATIAQNIAYLDTLSSSI